MKQKLIIMGAILLTLTSCSSLRNRLGGSGHGGDAQGDDATAQSWQPGDGWSHVSNTGPKNLVILFAFDKSDIPMQDQQLLNQQAHYLASHPKAMVKIIGHTDERGSREYNMGLGWRRARAVATFLEHDGVPKGQMEVTSFGAEKPVMLGHNETAYRQNRRVQVIYKRY